MFWPSIWPVYPTRFTRSMGEDPSDPKCQGRFWLDMSRECVAAAAFSLLSSCTGPIPAACRSALTESSMRNCSLPVSPAPIRYARGSGLPSVPSFDVVGVGSQAASAKRPAKRKAKIRSMLFHLIMFSFAITRQALRFKPTSA